MHMFLQGLTAPTYVVNAITIATYKKYALVSLIHTGKVMSSIADISYPLAFSIRTL